MLGRRLSNLMGLALAASAAAGAHEFFSTKITWSREVSRIVQKSCIGCHREGGKAFSLVNFEEARPWAKAIKEEVLSRRMPPWGVVKGFGSLAADQGLTQDEISLIADWVEGGAPEGEKMYLPRMTPPPAPAARRPSPASRILDQLSLTLSSPVILQGIAPRGTVTAGSQVTAELPDGSVEPLLWVIDGRAATAREFYYRKPIPLPTGTRVTVNRPGGQWKLLLGPATSARPATGGGGHSD